MTSYNEINLSGRTVAFLAVDGFEQAELEEPLNALRDAGAAPKIISEKPGQIQGFHHDEKADLFRVDATFDQCQIGQFDAVVLPGGVVNADQIRMNPDAQRLVKEFDATGKPLAVICHGAWLLISSGLTTGRTLTSWPSLKDDLLNAGAHWIDQEVVTDRNWISSRNPADLPAFIGALAGAISAIEEVQPH